MRLAVAIVENPMLNGGNDPPRRRSAFRAPLDDAAEVDLWVALRCVSAWSVHPTSQIDRVGVL